MDDYLQNTNYRNNTDTVQQVYYPITPYNITDQILFALSLFQ